MDEVQVEYDYVLVESDDENVTNYVNDVEGEMV